MTTALADQAGTALDIVGTDPTRAATLGSAVVVRARATGDHAAWSIAERALGLAAQHSRDLDAALAHLRNAVNHGRRAGTPRLAAQARMSLAFALSSRGSSGPALREIEAALSDLDGMDRARARAQRAAILHQLGRLDEALAEYTGTLPPLRAAGDWTWVWRVLSNRAVLQGQRLQLAAAEADLAEAARLCEQMELRNFAAYVQQNLGWVATLKGDVPAALHYLDDAERRLRALGSQLGEVQRDRAELLLSVNLAAEARAAAGDAVSALERERRRNVLPEARLLLARAATLDGDPLLAVEQAGRAAAEFRRQGRTDWLAVARLALLTSRRAADPRARVSLVDAERVAAALEAARWSAAATEARVLAGAIALERGWTAVAAAHWERAGRHRDRGPATVRARAWYATALRRGATGDNRGAARAARAGLRVVDEYRATMGATDLRARAAGHRTDLARLGLGLALDSGRAGRVLAWAERGRASLLRPRSVRPPEDEVLRAALAELRAVMSEVDQARREGRADARAVVRQIAVERRVRDHFRRQRGAAELTGPVPPAALAQRLGEAALVEFIQRDRELYAVTLSRRGLRLRRLDDAAAVPELLDRVTFALRRIGRGRRSTVDSRAAAAAVLRDAAGRLDAVLLQPLRADLAGAPLVVVPTGRLQSLPWSILPSCVNRPVVVAPSAAAWHQAAVAPAGSTRSVAAVAGPDLPGAELEATRVAAIYGVPAVTGPDATAEAALRTLRRSDLVHLAAHGRLSAENPLFTSLTLADGPLMVYDVEGLDRVPATVVLAACDSGRHVVVAGDELLGLAATFLARGTQRVVGSVIPIPDLETASVMVEFHQRLAAGHSAATALARAQHSAAAEGGSALAAAAGFVCVGADVHTGQSPARPAIPSPRAPSPR